MKTEIAKTMAKRIAGGVGIIIFSLALSATSAPAWFVNLVLLVGLLVILYALFSANRARRRENRIEEQAEAIRRANKSAP
jgi:hypothetical protein